MKKTKNLIEVLFSTKNYSKITSAFNSLSPREKQIVLSEKKAKARLYKIADANLLVTILIDLPYEVRENFLKGIDKDKFSEDEKVLIDFLRLPNYEDFDYDRLSAINELKNKQVLTLIFRKQPKEKLRNIILENYNQFINEFAFIEYSRKSPELNLELSLINILEENSLVAELKRRKSKKLITNIDIREFVDLSTVKQNRIISNINSTNLIQDIIDAYNQKLADTSPDDLVELFKDILSEYSYVKLIELQVILSILDDEPSLELIKIFFKKVLKFDNNVEEKYLRSLLFNFRQLSNKTDELYQVCKSKPFTIINYLNTGSIDSEITKTFENVITVEQFQKINLKKVNKINKLFTRLFQRSEDYSEKNAISFSYKLYLIFGYENAIDLLNSKFGKIDYETLSKLLTNCNVKNVEFEKSGNAYEPIINKELINFLIGDKKDNNTTIKRMLRGELAIIQKNFSNLYNNFKRFQTAIGDKIHLNKLLPLLEKNPFILLPDEYKLTKDIIDNVIKSYKYSDVMPDQLKLTVDEKDCVIKACEFYHQNLESRITSSIPRVYGKTEDNYGYEVLKLDDPVIMTLGYQTGCCFRLNGESKVFLKYCSKSPYGRVIVIKNENNEICSMVPIIRNGNVINGNSIEKNSKGDQDKVFEALKCAFNEILEYSSCYEEEPIVACLVTNLHHNCLSSHKLKNNIFPISPVKFYTNYNGDTYIVSSKDSITEQDFKLYTPDSIYYDARPDILVYHSNMTDKQRLVEVNKRINAVLYKLNEPIDERLKYYRYIICSEDWFLKLDWNGVSGKFLDKDPRAIEEYNAVKTYLEKKLDVDNIYEINWDDTDLSGEGVSAILPKKLILDSNTQKKEG